jgi:hypothetical protein
MDSKNLVHDSKGLGYKRGVLVVLGVFHCFWRASELVIRVMKC